MFDEIRIEVIALNELNNKFFEFDPLPNIEWQTKSLECCMLDYYLKYDVNNKLKLFALEKPSEVDEFYRPFYVLYTTEELKEKEKSAWFFKHDGYWKDEVWLTENRRQISMGELPHTILNICNSISNPTPEDSKNRKWYELDLKFTDGILVAVKRTWLDKKFNIEKESEWFKL